MLRSLEVVLHSQHLFSSLQSPESQPTTRSDTLSRSSPSYVSPARRVLRVLKRFSAHTISGCQIPWTPPRVYTLAVMRKRFAGICTGEDEPQLKCTCAIADMSSKTRFSNQSRDYHWTFHLTRQTFHWTNRCALGFCGICGFGGGFSLNSRKYKFPFSGADWWMRLWGFYYVLILSKCVPESAGVLSTTRVCGDTRPSVKQCLVFASTIQPNDPSIIIPSCIASPTTWLWSWIKSHQQT